MKRSKFVLAAMMMVVGALAGCNGGGMSKGECADCKDGAACEKCSGEQAKKCDKCGNSPCNCPKDKVSTANEVCPIGGDEIDAKAVKVSLSREYKGKTIGFCCEGCTHKFDKADAAGKDKIFAAAMAHPAK